MMFWIFKGRKVVGLNPAYALNFTPRAAPGGGEMVV